MTGQRALIGLAVIAMMLVSLSPIFAGTANYSYDNVNRLSLLNPSL